MEHIFFAYHCYHNNVNVKSIQNIESLVSCCQIHTLVWLNSSTVLYKITHKKRTCWKKRRYHKTLFVNGTSEFLKLLYQDLVKGGELQILHGNENKYLILQQGLPTVSYNSYICHWIIIFVCWKFLVFICKYIF